MIRFRKVLIELLTRWSQRSDDDQPDRQRYLDVLIIHSPIHIKIGCLH